MNFQQYLKKVNVLTNLKNALYDQASLRLSEGNKDGAREIYAKIDGVDAELNGLENPNDRLLAEDEGILTF